MRAVHVMAIFLLALPGQVAANKEGFRKEWGQIVAGRDATAAPYQATLMNPRPSIDHFCTAVFIAYQWVLTAAKCLCNTTASTCKPLNNFVVVYGQVQNTNANYKLISDIRIHEGFDGNGDNDIALLKLTEPINPSVDIGVLPIPITRAAEFVCPNTVATVYGWGETDPSVAAKSNRPPTLQQLSVRISSDVDLITAYKSFSGIYIPPSANVPCFSSNCALRLFGAMSSPSGGTVCTADTGGPLVVSHDASPSKVALAGITSAFFSSSSSRCLAFSPGGQTPLPSTYTQITYFIPWISNIVGNATGYSVVGSVCGDGRVGSGEECDDRNVVGQDGCNEQCRVEAGWICVPQTNYDSLCSLSVCSRVSSTLSDQTAILGIFSNGSVPNNETIAKAVSGSLQGFPISRIVVGTPEAVGNGMYKVPITFLSVTSAELIRLQSILSDQTIPQALTDQGVLSITTLAARQVPLPAPSPAAPQGLDPNTVNAARVSSNTGAIIGGLVGCIAGLLCIVGLVLAAIYFLCRKQQGPAVATYSDGPKEMEETYWAEQGGLEIPRHGLNYDHALRNKLSPDPYLMNFHSPFRGNFSGGPAALNSGRNNLDQGPASNGPVVPLARQPSMVY